MPATVEQHLRTWIEGELRALPARKARLDYLKQLIATATPARDESGIRSGVSNPTLARVLAIQRDTEIQRLEPKVSRAERAVGAVTNPLYQTIIQLLYLEGRLTVADVADTLGYSRRQLERLRDRAIAEMAMSFGEE